jgi:hypothetical protein
MGLQDLSLELVPAEEKYDGPFRSPKGERARECGEGNVRGPCG